MLKNYLKIAIRIISKQRLISAINILGLSIGISVCTIILLYVQHEFTYDGFHEKKDRIFRVVSVEKENKGEVQNMASQPLALGPAFVQNYPEISRMVRLFSNIGFIRSSDNIYREEILFSDPEFFEIFSFPLIKGDPKNVLVNPNSIVISQVKARSYFGKDDPIGKTITIQYNKYTEDFLVTGVVGNFPDNSSITFDFILPFSKEPVNREIGENWSCSQYETFILINENTDIKLFKDKIQKFPVVLENLKSEPNNKQGISFWKKNITGLNLQRISDIHFDPSTMGQVCDSKSSTYTYILSGIAFLILFIACINTMILNISKSENRIKEIGIRKISGGNKLILFNQLLVEALLLNFISLIFGIILVNLLLPLFNSLININLKMDLLKDLKTFLGITGIFILTGTLSSVYPSIILAKYKPVNLFKGKIILRGKNIFSRILITLQYSISAFFIIAMLVISMQLDFINKHDLGFNKENIIKIGTGRNPKVYKDIEDELLQIPEITGIAGSNIMMGIGSVSTILNIQNIERRVALFQVTESFIPLFDIKMKEGRNFSKEFTSDEKNSIIVNESFVKELGWEYPVIGRKIERYGKNPQDFKSIIGVVKDFNFLSLEKKVEPMFMEMDARSTYIMMIKTRPETGSEVISKIQKIYRKYNPDLPFSYEFLQDSINKQYKRHIQLHKISIYSVIISILLSALGLYALSSLSFVKRRKEIGIRKVLGISNMQIGGLVSWDFIKLIMLGNLISWPIAYFAINNWLQSFEYRISLNAWYYISSALFIFTISLFAVSVQMYKSIRENPVNSLRYE